MTITPRSRQADATVPPLMPRTKRRRRHSLTNTKDYFSRSMKNLVGINEKDEVKPKNNALKRSNSATTNIHALSISPRDPTASPRVQKTVDNFFAEYYEKHPISRLDEEQLMDNPELEL
mmetsp:Transcript_1250/g.1587  ORF Transcript_1250/g.1587 Transcript_1250/m.1587 type:complete len:119 (-) Transcript_1250:94-450(-)